MSEPDLQLYDLTGCPYCAKVRHALDDLDLSYVRIDVPRSRQQRTEVYEASGQYRVPVLVDRSNGIEGMPESSDIVEYLYAEYGSAEDAPSTGVVDRLRSQLEND